ncbi:unnamed protein product [Rotaria sp. Silwood1]|nr:unnamed protein product [Rotaria sp. Silwood1]CAF3959176.1 unnamed protein product [Rotaria sp. Silwood1]CAF4845281.1 unnamed protein product [Rotaria sp. Silwood1]CAF4989244.1 unnamed protein product [Rotaria sp. Silwood1]
MSNTAESIEEQTTNDLKAGHAPAMKVDENKKTTTSTQGQGNTGNSNDNTTAGTGEGRQEKTDETVTGGDEDTSGTVVQHQPAGQLIAGQFVRIQDAFPTEAVKSIHEKHFDNVPKHQPHTQTSHHDAKFIIQPRKM